jgi:hypothetical protein
VCDRRDYAHRAARRQAGDVATQSIDAETTLHLERNLVEILGFPAALVAVTVEPEAPAVGIAKAVVTGDEGCDESEAKAVGSGR